MSTIYEPGDNCRFLANYRILHAADCPEFTEGTITNVATDTIESGSKK